jgi:hypothetical protein
MRRMLKVDTLPLDTQKELKRITSIEPKDLKKEEAGFLRARKDYLRPEQVRVFASILGVKKSVEPEK